jgi:acetate kinase
MNILVLNAGSSGQKACLYCIAGDTLPDTAPAPLWTGTIEWSDSGAAPRAAAVVGGREIQPALPVNLHDRRAVLNSLLSTLWSGVDAPLRGVQDIDVVGHRVVHGGADFAEPVRVTDAVKEAVSALAPLAPEHNPAARDGMDAVQALLGAHVPQVAVFDTAFHRTMSAAATTYPLPREWSERYGIRRYGFHGISHAWSAERAVRLLGRGPENVRLVTCHLGNGCSLAAVRDGRSVDTTMGFTPLEGLMMGARSGSVDPGALLYLLRQGIAVDDLDRGLNAASGLYGVSGVSADLRAVLHARDAGSASAALALDVYAHRLRREIGGMVAVLGGVDALVFTGGVGEHSPDLRRAACDTLGFLGLRWDEERNRLPGAVERDIAGEHSAVRVFVIPAQEDWVIARESWRIARITQVPD